MMSASKSIVRKAREKVQMILTLLGHFKVRKFIESLLNLSNEYGKAIVHYHFGKLTFLKDKKS